MSNSDSGEVAQAKVAPVRRISALWLIPIVTLVVGVWMVYDNWSKRGPLITLEFSTAEGLEAGKTRIKTRDVEIGQVEEITLNAQLDGVIVMARINSEFKHLLVEDSRFWVVQPTVSISGVSGLSTLMTGQYIQFSPGTGSRRSDHFRGLDYPPLTPLRTPGLRIRLTTDGDFSFARGDLIHYKGIRVGRVETVEFDFPEQKIYYSAFIDAPYDQLITRETRFWKASGVRAELTGQGVVLEAGSLDTLILGGISFATPAGVMAGEAAGDQALFYVYPNRAAINEKQYLFSIPYWVMVKGSIGGLRVGAPVTHRGVQVGKVVQTDFVPDGGNLLDKTMEIPVLIEINPGRLGLPDSEESLQRASADIETWIRQGLTAIIKSQNFLLGQRMVALEYSDATVESELAFFNGLAVIPTGVDTIDKFTESIEEFIAKVNQLPVESMIEKLEQMLQDGSEALASVRDLAESGDTLVSDDRIVALLEQATATLASVDGLAQSFSSESQTNQELRELLNSMSALLEELKPLVADLRHRPNSLIFPSNQAEEAEPRRKQP